MGIFLSTWLWHVNNSILNILGLDMFDKRLCIFEVVEDWRLLSGYLIKATLDHASEWIFVWRYLSILFLLTHNFPGISHGRWKLKLAKLLGTIHMETEFLYFDLVASDKIIQVPLKLDTNSSVGKYLPRIRHSLSIARNHFNIINFILPS